LEHTLKNFFTKRGHNFSGFILGVCLIEAGTSIYDRVVRRLDGRDYMFIDWAYEDFIFGIVFAALVFWFLSYLEELKVEQLIKASNSRENDAQ
jgi:hypothetical protein